MTQPNTITSSERIAELSDISDDVPSLLNSASQALSALAGKTLPADSDAEAASPAARNSGLADVTVEDAKTAFTAHATAYFVNLQSIMARLRRQAYALEEAGVIAAESPALTTGSQTAQQSGHLGQTSGRVNLNQGAGVRRAAPIPASSLLGSQKQSAGSDEIDGSVSGGLGDLDVTLLNSRAGKGGWEKQTEVLGEARRVLHGFLRQSGQDEPMRDAS